PVPSRSAPSVDALRALGTARMRTLTIASKKWSMSAALAVTAFAAGRAGLSAASAAPAIVATHATSASVRNVTHIVAAELGDDMAASVRIGPVAGARCVGRELHRRLARLLQYTAPPRLHKRTLRGHGLFQGPPPGGRGVPPRAPPPAPAPPPPV